MLENVAIINDKAVRLCRPYAAPLTPMVGREPEMRKILAAWISGEDAFPLSPLLLGDPGLGKNRIVYECARLSALEFYMCQGHEEFSAEDLICTVRFSDDPDKKMDYTLSSVATAMLKGGIGFVDEIAKIRPRALAPLASLLDERRYLDSNILGERIHAHPAFRFIAATNTADLKGNLLPDFIRSRVRPVIRVGYPERREINQILSRRYWAFRQQDGNLQDHFWSLWESHKGDTPPTLRDSVQFLPAT
jgi:MoxR-like ATPase